jgi:hypothetical protein
MKVGFPMPIPSTVTLHKHAAPIDALNLDWKHYTELKLKMIGVHCEKAANSKLDGLTEIMENLLIRFNDTKRVVKDNIKGSGHLCKRHVGIATPSSH